ncbi:hypothetical protein WA158_000847 [Blastocystis sp. Blastoise]
MYSYYTRASNVFYTSVWCLAAMCICCALLVEMYPHPGNVSKLSADRILRFGPIDLYGTGDEFDSCIMTFNLTYDLSGEWNWNVRSLYAFVVMNYTSPDYKRQEMIIWDRIHMDPKNSTFTGISIMNEYLPRDMGKTLRGKQVSLSFAYDVQPFFGRQKIFRFPPRETFTFPNHYVNEPK